MGPLGGPIAGLVGGCRSILTPPMAPVPKQLLQAASAGVRRGSPPAAPGLAAARAGAGGVCGRRLGPRGRVARPVLVAPLARRARIGPRALGVCRETFFLWGNGALGGSFWVNHE